MVAKNFKMSYKLPNYKEDYFEYKQLNKIYGKPTRESLLTLFRQLKRNAQRVPTTLGGGQLGYLALTVTPAVYNAIPNAANFVRPVDPGIFTLTPNPTPTTRGTRAAGPTVAPPLTPADIATQKAQYDENKRLYNEVQAVEMILRNQLIEAIEPIYLRPLRNNHTDMINESIPDIMLFLLTNYGQLSDPQLLQKEQDLIAFTYNPQDQPDVVFNEIDDYSDLCDIINPIDDRKKLQLSYCIFQKTGIFRDTLKTWNAKAAVEKTYANFKLFMRQEHADLTAVGALSIQQSSLNETKLLQTLNDHQEQMSQRLDEQFKVNFIEALTHFNQLDSQSNQSFSDVSSSFTLPPVAANSIQYSPSNETIQQLLNTVKELSVKVEKLSSRNQSNRNTNNDINPKTGKPFKRYCWSCGCCPHWGRNCPNKKRGHKDEATFKNRMGGSNEGCLGA